MFEGFVSDKVYALVHSPETVTSSLAAAPPTESVGAVAEKLFGLSPQRAHNLKVGHRRPTKEDLDRVAECGKFTSRPSDLFLQIYGEVLRTYEYDPLANLCSPSLTASTGVIPLSIISVIPEIMRHYADCIVRAEKEVFFATSAWEASVAADVITGALRELSRRAIQRGEKVVVKIMYDRGNIKQMYKPHQIVPVAEYTGDAVKLPHPDEVPGIDMEVCNYHQPLLGTFHAKYMVVDRKIALINSNNTQDRVNMEMMSHVEGPIVEAFYDMALLSWNNAFNPPLPLLACPPTPPAKYQFGDDHAHIAGKDLAGAKEDAAESIKTHDFPEDMKHHDDGYDADYVAEQRHEESGLHGRNKFSKLAALTKHLNTTLTPDTKATLPEGVDMEDFTPHIIHAPHDPFPIAMVNRRPRGAIEYTDINNPQDMAWLAAFEYAERKVFIQTPTFNAAAVVEATLAAVRRGIEVILYVNLGYNDGGESLPYQGGTNEVVIANMYKQLEPEHKKLLKAYWYTGKDMCRPVNASKKQRNCHVKLMIVDDHVGIMGNGNQDSQSWYHSQEANIMIDSPAVCKEWADGVRANQNTHLYGRLDDDGIWRDSKDGSVLEDMGSTKGGSILGLGKGLVSAVQRVRGKGGF
ncbi:IQ calmodulin-binding motif protein [Agrocybe pediades]|nr:IQ calmodulin-binding motif protein [Agrocybe pediades]